MAQTLAVTTSTVWAEVSFAILAAGCLRAALLKVRYCAYGWFMPGAHSFLRARMCVCVCVCVCVFTVNVDPHGDKVLSIANINEPVRDRSTNATGAAQCSREGTTRTESTPASFPTSPSASAGKRFLFRATLKVRTPPTPPPPRVSEAATLPVVPAPVWAAAKKKKVAGEKRGRPGWWSLSL